MHVIQKWKYILFFLFSDFLPFIKTDRNGDITTFETENTLTTTDLSRETEVLRIENLENDIEDENEIMRIFLVGGVELRTAIKDEEKIWKNGTVPYEISEDYDKENKDFILNAMAEFHNRTCVHFKPRKDEKSYIFIIPGAGCSATVGRVPQANRVSLNEACFVKGIVLHELMHALGFIHEQNRPDRDEFVKIVFDNIKEGTEKNFDKYSETTFNVTTFNQTYDYGSVMHYGAFDFAKNKSMPTIIPLQEGVEIGQREDFSEKDLVKINLLYNCAERNNTSDDPAVNTDSPETVIKNEADKRKEKLKRFRLFYLLSRLL